MIELVLIREECFCVEDKMLFFFWWWILLSDIIE